MKSLYLKILISTILCLSLGILSGFNTSDSITGWYPFIIKPSWNPPNWIFGPIWTVLYIGMGVAVALIWHSRHDQKQKAILFFIIQFVFNLCWSFIFFNLHQIGWALIEIVAMFFLILITTIRFYNINKHAAYLMIPYLLWVSFATVLNASIWYLNK